MNQEEFDRRIFKIKNKDLIDELNDEEDDDDENESHNVKSTKKASLSNKLEAIQINDLNPDDENFMPMDSDFKRNYGIEETVVIKNEIIKQPEDVQDDARIN